MFYSPGFDEENTELGWAEYKSYSLFNLAHATRLELHPGEDGGTLKAPHAVWVVFPAYGQMLASWDDGRDAFRYLHYLGGLLGAPSLGPTGAYPVGMWRQGTGGGPQ